MKKSNNLVEAAMAGLAQAKRNSTHAMKGTKAGYDNNCGGKGGCGSKQISCNSKT
jgi:hypothetical protein